MKSNDLLSGKMEGSKELYCQLTSAVMIQISAQVGFEKLQIDTEIKRRKMGVSKFLKNNPSLLGFSATYYVVIHYHRLD